MNGTTFEFGDQVRHPKRPEWGVGSVVKSEYRPVNGKSTQCVSVRFPGAGIKVINTSVVGLEVVAATTSSSGPSSNGVPTNGARTSRNGTASQPQRSAEPQASANPSSFSGDERHAVAQWVPVAESDWLAPVARKKIEEGMAALPEDATDPFRTVEQRLKATLDLYRFDRSGRSLIEWATAQSGLADPLSRFNRHELEQFHERWRHGLDIHLRRLVNDPEADPSKVRELLKQAHPQAKHVAKRRHAMR